MLTTLVNAFREKEIRKKLINTVLILLVFRLGCYIPIPGLNIDSLGSAVGENDFLQLMSAITGGSLSNGTLFALGIVPYINSFIIMQLMTLVIPALDRLSKEGEEGRRKITQYTRVVALILAAVQAVGIMVSWNNSGLVTETFGTVWVTMVAVVIILIGGSALVMWLGERITEYGIGNGSSLIIFVGILSTAGSSTITALKTIASGTDDTQNANAWYFLIFLIVVVLVFGIIVFMDLAQRNVTVQYAKQIKGNKMYGGQTTHIPIRVNASNVMPIIFASAFLMFPQMLASFWPESKFYIWYSGNFGVGSWVYIVVMSLLILFFAFFYAQIQFNLDDVARNIQQNGGFVPGIRPGRPTADYLAKINNRVTLLGALFLAFVALVPSIVFKSVGNSIGMSNAFTATGMLIVVSVALEFNLQLENQLMMKHYKGFLK